MQSYMQQPDQLTSYVACIVGLILITNKKILAGSGRDAVTRRNGCPLKDGTRENPQTKL
jgi:hypothetical protein